MRAAKAIFACLIAIVVDCAAGDTLAIENPEGDVYVLVVPGQEFTVKGQTGERKITKEDIRVERFDGTYFIDVLPADLAQIDLLVRVPYAWPLEIKTVSGDIEITGNVPYTRIETGTGSIDLSIPVKTTALFVESEEPPGALSIPPGSGYLRVAASNKEFRIETKGKRAGAIEIQAFSPARLSVRDYQPVHNFELDEPLSLELARPLLRVLRKKQNRAGPAGERRVMVSLRAEPQSTRLSPDDIAVIENGEPRPVVEVQPGRLGVNVTLIFQQVDTWRWRGVAAPRDRVFVRRLIGAVRGSDAIAMAQAEGGFVRVLSKAATDRSRLFKAYNAAARTKSRSELLAAALLSHQVFGLADREKRNAVVIVTAADNYNCVTRAPDKEIAEAVAVLARTGALFYAVGSGCKDFDRLAKLSGGRSIGLKSDTAEAAADRLAAELAALYSVTYISKVPAGTMPDHLVVKVRGRSSQLRHGPAVPLR